MPNYYSIRKNVYKPGFTSTFKLSRSKIDLFINCPKCFWLDRRLGIGQPPGYPFTLNNAVDLLLKKEFDIHRVKGKTHPLMKAYNINAVPLAHEKIDEWRDAMRRGITFHHQPTNLIISGGIDDVWINKNGEYIIVDYKSTAKTGEVSIDAEWQKGYKRQMEVYQWLFIKNGYKVSKTGYFVYCNGKTDRKAFDGKLDFDISILPYKGDTNWIESTLADIRDCLDQKNPPDSNSECDYCKYRKFIKESKIES